MSQGEFIVSALKYRPSDWDQVVGQSSITTTLKNAIASEEIAKAYLFCGPRGVGKTTSARIFAKAINEKYLGPGQDLSFNVFELDAASNNSVDDIRNLIDQVRIQPPVGKYKVYVIDEVHMLSQQAFNAFLKTLEEPPPHAIFVLATTEKHKVLPTILSRCQIYDFSRIQVKDMTQHLATIANDQGVTFEDEALHLIAQKADGALRDALSIFDQMVSFSGKNLTYASVAENLNILDYDFFFRICDAIHRGNMKDALLVHDEIMANGFDSLLFITGLASHLRDLLVSSDTVTAQLLDTTEGIKSKYVAQSQIFEMTKLIAFLEILQQAETRYRTTQNKRLLTEVSLLQMCKLQGLSDAPATEKKTTNETQKSTLPAQPAPGLNNSQNTEPQQVTESNQSQVVESVKAAEPKKTLPVSEAAETASHKSTVEPPSVEEQHAAAAIPNTEPETNTVQAEDIPSSASAAPSVEEAPTVEASVAESQTMEAKPSQPEPTQPAVAEARPVESETTPPAAQAEPDLPSGGIAAAEPVTGPEVRPEQINEIPPSPTATINSVSEPATEYSADAPENTSSSENQIEASTPSTAPSATPAEAAAAQMGLTPTSRKVKGSVSIVDFNDDDELEEEENEEKEVEAGDAVAEGPLIRAWKAYAEIIKEKRKYSFYSTLNNRTPAIIDDNTIHINLENEVQMEDLQVEKAELMSFIRTELNNPAIKLTARIEESEDTNIGLQTPREQLKHMVKKNPNLGEMQKRFDLDVEY